MRSNGDNMLSGNDHSLWSIHHHLIIEWQCYTFFKSQGYNCRTQEKGHVWWYVPRNHPNCDEICDWLETELEQFEDAGGTVLDLTFPGTDVHIAVTEFNGVNGYLERRHSEALAQEMSERLIAEIDSARNPKH